MATTNVEDGAFDHVALARDIGAGKLRLYVDGAKELEAWRSRSRLGAGRGRAPG